MKKLLTLALALLMVLSLAACGGGNDKPDPSGSSTTDPGTSQQQPSNTPDDSTPSGGNELTDEEKAAAAFAQFGVDMDDIIADVEGELYKPALVGIAVKDPLTFGARAVWRITPNETLTQEQKDAYREKIYNLLKSVAEDGEIHGQMDYDTTLSLDEYFGSCMYRYNGHALNVTLELGETLGIEIYFAE